MRYTSSFLFFVWMTCAQLTWAQSGNLSQIGVDPHYFVRSARPFFWLGDTQWELFHQLSAGDAGALLLERKKQGFTVVQCMATGVFQEWGIMKKLLRDTSNEAWLNGNPLQMNEQYFRRMDSIIAYAAGIDMLLVIGVYHAQDVDNNRITLANARLWARWLAGRYRNASHVTWSMYPHADSASLPILAEVIKGIREGDGGQPPGHN